MAYEIKLKKYFENLPYGQDSLPSEIHGPRNQETINATVKVLVDLHDQALKGIPDENGVLKKDESLASSSSNGIKFIAKQLENLKMIKEEYALNKGGGTLGKDMFSSWTSTIWEDEFMTEKGTMDFDKDMNLLLDVPHLDYPLKKVEDITDDWIVKGDEESRFIQHYQELSGSSNKKFNQDPPYDIDYATHNLLKTGWQVFASDEIMGREPFIQTWLKDNIDTDGDVVAQINELSEKGRLDKESFNPETDPDKRLHVHFSKILKHAWNPNYLSQSETKEADELIAQLPDVNTLKSELKTKPPIPWFPPSFKAGKDIKKIL